ncbi:peptidase MA family metallohydrolase [Tautonia marina]|uniref:peptidase MA family metallohydrolase n=1 Tax=Tautonia marina TaxID=2653855 RepID=UPI0012607A6A|nr:hypothetical protein [Tautonia marina]
MHRLFAPTAALMAAALLSLSAALCHARTADPPADLQAGREALSRGDGPAAVALLESALLAVSSAERPAVLDDLRRAYERAAAQAEAAGDTRHARLYRENLLILNRPKRPADPAVSRTSNEAGTPPDPDEPPAESPSPAPQPEDSLPPPESPGLSPVQEPTAGVLETDPPKSDSTADGEPQPPVSMNEADTTQTSPQEQTAPIAQPPAADSSPAPLSAPPQGQTLAEVLRSADAAFRSQKYEDAGRIYALLAQRGQLPESHKAVWAYCRFVAVARRINAQPSTPAEWSAIHAEIREVRALAPEIWFSEYLRRLATERSAAVGAKPSAFIVRGQSESGETVRSTASWQVLETENFRIYHVDPSLANQLARRVEDARSDLYRYWTASSSASSWSPRCDLYLYPNAATFERMTAQPADSPGFSTLDLSRGRVVSRRIHLRADADRLLDAVAPHEVSHVVLADLFPGQQIPRWADEGMAVIAEPIDAQVARLADLEASLASGRVFRTGAMMSASGPKPRDWDLFMAQSASLTRYLIQLDSPARFLSFLRASQRLGTENALKTVYGFQSAEDLHTRWLSHARRKSATTPDELIAVRPDATPRAR